jgi:hypothetical protein
MKNTVIEHLDAAWVQIKTGNRLFAVDNLYWAVLELATAGKPTARVESSAQENPLSLYDLKQQVDTAVIEMQKTAHLLSITRLIPEVNFVWEIGDFEIRRRK